MRITELVTSPFGEPSINLHDNGKPTYLHWDVNDIAMTLSRINKLVDRQAAATFLMRGHLKTAAAVCLRPGPMKNASKKITYHVRFPYENVNAMIEAQAKRAQKGPLKGLKCIAIRITGRRELNTKTTKLIEKHVLDMMNKIKRETKVLTSKKSDERDTDRLELHNDEVSKTFVMHLTPYSLGTM